MEAQEAAETGIMNKKQSADGTRQARQYLWTVMETHFRSGPFLRQNQTAVRTKKKSPGIKHSLHLHPGILPGQLSSSRNLLRSKKQMHNNTSFLLNKTTNIQFWTIKRSEESKCDSSIKLNSISTSNLEETIIANSHPIHFYSMKTNVGSV